MDLKFQFLLTRLSRGATGAGQASRGKTKISTHTPLARRDLGLSHGRVAWFYFYSHASREARRLVVPSSSATSRYFYSHASREARLLGLEPRTVRLYFYSHASREARRGTPLFAEDNIEFLLTRLSRGATRMNITKSRHI